MFSEKLLKKVNEFQFKPCKIYPIGIYVNVIEHQYENIHCMIPLSIYSQLQQKDD